MSGYSLAEQRPLPELVEPRVRPLSSPSEEPLVDGGHGEIVWLSHYELGNWSNAVSICWLRREVVRRLTHALGGLPDGF
ncbi:MAG: hypothetical protein ACC652_15605, partial [Acidimicrobiales bacterium]